MKKAISILFLISCLLSALFLINREMSVRASPTTRTWTVDDDGPANFTNIQEAINDASSGDTIFVHIGTYYEHVVINKTITLVGEDNNSTIIDGNETGNVIYIRANNVTVTGFTVRKSYLYSGILVDHSTGNVIINNKIICNYEGISLLYSTSNVVCDNTISSNYDGVYLYYSSSNVVSGNFILHNDLTGMSLYYSSNNVVCGNTILSNYHGINLASSSDNNTIYHNNFNNTYQVWSESENFWNYGDEGNYWSNYTGQDLNKDGIGDTPYYINAANKDNNPLMGMFSEFSIALGGEIYSVTVISNSTISVFRFQIGAETGNKIINFNATGKDTTTGFCRVKIPTELMNYPYIVMTDSKEIISTLLNVSNETYAYLYFAYLHKNQTITIIYSETLHLYIELLDKYLQLQMDLSDLNETYHALLENYNILLSNYTQIQISLDELINSYQELSSLNRTYYELLANYLELQMGLFELNGTYHALLSDYNILLYNYSIFLYNYSQLQTSFQGLNHSYLEHLIGYSEQIQNIRNLTYIFAALTAIFVITTIYLSKRAHTKVTTKVRAIEEE